MPGSDPISPQIGHFLASQIRLGAVDPVQGQHEFPLGAAPISFQQGFDVLLQTQEHTIEFAVASVGYLFEVMNYFVDIDRHQGTAGTNKGHGQGAAVAEDLFHFRHGFQGIGIGDEELAERAVAGKKQPVQFFRTQPRRGG
jgi:hypothetical protein